ncbi:hypothetical protein LTR84_012653 [Exophiala bonariae]|uniref:BZIP domain-containing protein n=1 Tax=Exophiala bonariae TaxID=1690606 RepID=A0AAV9NF27_9EURO|nr:hypothetical protein LTR84_012653 [Exophiala bonariae]
MSSASPKRKRGPDLPLDTQRLPRPFHLDDGIDDVESPRTKVSRTFGTLDLEDEIGSNPEAAAQREMNLPTHPLGRHDEPSKNHSPAQSSPQPHIKNSVTLPKPPQKDNFSSTDMSKVSPRSKSPPLEGEISEHFWHDSEITGHDPTDPTDDGYGINGIGFRPTPALAWSRSQHRKRQLDDLKSREAREARQQRSERRKRVISESEEDSMAMDNSPRKSVRVRFENG